MDKLNMMSKDNVQANIEKIKALFPNTVTEVIKDGKVTLGVDFDVLKQELSDTLIDDKEERYQFTWPDKKKSILLANTPISATLRPCKEESVDFDNTQNLYIEGDNLDVLKLLQETYLGKIKMIYIDPPYNTGNDFIYNDDFSVDGEEWKSESGDYDNQGNRLVQNHDSNGRFHTDWLNMIYPRLRLAKDLLSDDGVIFISMDENESVNLRKICDEIFGIQNYLTDFIRKTKSSTNDSVNGINCQHEYILVYAKEIAKAKLCGEIKDTSNYKNPDGDPNGEWVSSDPSARSGSENARFGITNPYTGTVDYPPQGRYWAFAKSTFEKWVQTGKVVFKKEVKPGERGFIVKKYLSELRSKYNLVDSLFATSNGFMNQVATKEMNELFYDIGENFSYPKPLSLIYSLIKYADSKDSIILDFFSGSATTAHAVMQLNAEDGGNRKFIMVQLPEPCDEKSEAYKAGYKNICEIGKERIRRAGKKIKEELESKNKDLGKEEQLSLTSNHYPLVSNSQTSNLDIGFRVLKLDSSNMKDVFYRPSELTLDMLASLESNIKEDRTPFDLLFQVMLELGKPLSAKIEEKVIAGKNVYVVDENDLIACFDENITEEVVKTIAQMKPLYAVFRDNSFSSDSVGINNEQLFKTYSPTTVVKVL